MSHARFTTDLSTRKAVLGVLWSVLGMSLAGCSAKAWDPSQIGRFRPTPAVNVILNSLGVAEETPVAWENAQEPQPSDIVAAHADYALRAGDTVRISIYELYQEGAIVVNDYVVPETGKISVPDVGTIQAAGLTERRLEEQIKQLLSPRVLRQPSVTVTLLDSQQRTFSILGNAVTRPSRYMIPRYDFRLADALATAGAQVQFNVSTIYVSRKGVPPAAVPADIQTPKQMPPELKLLDPGSPAKTQDAGPRRLPPISSGRQPPASDIPNPSEPAQKFESQRQMLDLIAPQAQSPWPSSKKVAKGTPARGASTDITASVVPQVVSPIEFGGTNPPAGPGPANTDEGGQRAQDTGRSTHLPPVVRPPSSEAAEPPSGAAKPKERTEWIFREGKWVQVVITEDGSRPPRIVAPGRGTANATSRTEEPAQPAPTPAGSPEGSDWIFQNGQWVRKQDSTPPAVPPATPVARAQPSAPTEHEPPQAATAAATPRVGESEKLPMDAEWEQAIQTRLIRIPADKLLAGDPRYNIIIKPGDTIHVPVDLIGEFVIMGNVNHAGSIDITGRPMTLKMAIAAAGGLGPLAAPKNVEVIRRIGTAHEEIVMVNLDKIASGEQPDFFIKPNDLINVGTDALARWQAVMRNAFRATFGFGFVYDRNFADVDYYQGFTHWF